jgi:hypothetical protein
VGCVGGVVWVVGVGLWVFVVCGCVGFCGLWGLWVFVGVCECGLWGVWFLWLWVVWFVGCGGGLFSVANVVSFENKRRLSGSGTHH